MGVQDGPRQRALVVGVGSFKAWTPLVFSEARAHEVASALAALDIELHSSGVLAHPEFAELEDALQQALRDAGAGGTLVVHLLSHGFLGNRSKALYVAAADSDGVEKSFHVEPWLQRVEDADVSPAVLLLLDVCHAGAPVREQWRVQLPTDRRKTWVIGATAAREDAYQGRFSQAVAAVLRDLRGLDIHPSVEWVPLEPLARRIRLELEQHCRDDSALPQDLAVDLIDPAREPEFRFFRNPAYRSDAKARFQMVQEQALRSFLAELDPVLDPEHYLGRALGRIDQKRLATTCCFSGRERDLELLARWLDGKESPSPGLRVVTGSPGVGKSALLGVLVCAAHPQLSEPAKAVRERVREECLPGRNEQLAAVHARGRQLGEIIESLARQLDLGQPSNGVWTAAELVAAIRERSQRPVIVVDALDEADNPKDLQDLLLLPLARELGSACRLLVGTRPWPEFGPLLEAAREVGGLLDLDIVEVAQLEQDLAEYVRRLLRTSRLHDEAPMRDLREGIAATVAAALAGQVKGAFLVAGLYTHHLRLLGTPVTVEELPEVPRTLGATMELHLDLPHMRVEPWLRPVLAAMAFAKDQGMPSRLLRAVAVVFRADPNGQTLSAEQLTAVLDTVRFYLRRSVDSDGTVLYRLFHQGLADHLQQHPLSPEEPIASRSLYAEPILEQLLAAIRLAPGQPARWDLAEPYLLRHAIQHAADAGRVDDLLADPEFLVHADRASLVSELRHAQREDARRHVMVYRTSAAHHPAVDPETRRQLLTIDAARHGAAWLVRRLALPEGTSVLRLPWMPVWSTGAQACAALLATLTGHTGSVWAVAVGSVEGRAVAVSGGADGTVRVWDLAASQPLGRPLSGHVGGVSGVAVGTAEGRAVAVSGGVDRTVRVWDLAAGQPLGEPLTGHTDWVRAVAVGTVDGRAVAVSGGADGTVRVWDLAAGQPLGRPLSGHVGGVSGVAVGTVEGRAVAVSGGADGTVRVWDLAASQPLGEPLTGHTDWVRAVAVGTAGGRAVAVSGSDDGTVRVWNLATGQPLGRPLSGHRGGVRAVAVDTADGRAVAVSGSDDRAVRVWDLAAGQPLGEPLAGHTRWVWAVAVGTAGGRAVAVSGSDDGTVRVWDLAAGQPLGEPLTGHRGGVLGVAVGTAAGRAVAVSGGVDGT
ncbi:MAG: AAA family ATPase, partial [Egibacteraceae bacterium]